MVGLSGFRRREHDKIDARCPFISVITVSLNAAETIEDTLASVSRQETDFAAEHICVDGGSTDTTRDTIDRWADRSTHIRRIYEADDGIFDAMNKGFRAARGEYVLFLNADDFLVGRNTLAMALNGVHMGADDNPDLIVGDVAMGRLGRWGLWRHRRLPSLLRRFPRSGLFPIHQGQFTRRTLLEAIGGFDSNLELASDVIQFYDLQRQFRPSIRVVNFDITFMRAGGAANAGVKAMYKGSVEIYRHLLLTHHVFRAAAMVLVKTVQSLAEIRLGRCPHDRWFASATNTVPITSTVREPQSPSRF
jgi:glycosyltransferase involved in cell wall biosynthesis